MAATVVNAAPAVHDANTPIARFMTNAGDAKKIYDSAQRRTLAQAIVDGIAAYRRLTER